MDEFRRIPVSGDVAVISPETREFIANIMDVAAINMPPDQAEIASGIAAFMRDKRHDFVVSLPVKKEANVNAEHFPKIH